MKRFVVTIIMLTLAFSTVSMAAEKKRSPRKSPQKRPIPQRIAQQRKNPHDEMRKKMMGLEFWKKEMACQKQEAKLNNVRAFMHLDVQERETEIARKHRMMELDIRERELEIGHIKLDFEIHSAEVHQRIDDCDFDFDDDDDDDDEEDECDDDDWGDRRRCGGNGCPVAPDKGCCGKGGLIFLAIIICHLLCGVWTYKDIKARNQGSGIWIALTFIAGLLGTLVYAVVRIGDNKE